MNPAGSDWKEITGSTADQLRQREREKSREEARWAPVWALVGTVLLLCGAVLVIISFALAEPLLFLAGAFVLFPAGFLILALSRLKHLRVGFRIVGRVPGLGGATIGIVQPVAVDPVQEEIADRAGERLAAWAGEGDESKPALKLPCWSCQALNEKQAHFCSRCGSILR
jgi:hypothetical protein